MSKKKFDILVGIYEATEFVHGERNGSIKIGNDETLGYLKKVLSDDDSAEDYGVYLAGEETRINELAVGDVVNVDLREPRRGIGLFARDLDEILKNADARVRGKRFYLIDSRYCSNNDNAPIEVVRYRKILELIKLLVKSGSVHLDSSEARLLYFNGKKQSLDVSFKCLDFQKVDEKILDDLIVFCSDELHQEQKLTILVESVFSLCSSLNGADKFPALLSGLGSVMDKLRDGYKLFVSNFSYEKIRDDVENAKIEYAGKIHKVFSDIQNQILGIPVATVIVATQMKVSIEGEDVFWINTAILSGCWIFVALVSILLFNQVNTLNVLSGEVLRQKQKMKKDHAAVAGKFDDVFSFLGKRVFHQKIAIYTVASVLVIGLILTHLIYFKNTPEIWDGIKSCFDWIFMKFSNAGR